MINTEIVASCELQAISYELRVTNYKLQITLKAFQAA